jgi:hypothetical protein
MLDQANRAKGMWHMLCPKFTISHIRDDSVLFVFVLHVSFCSISGATVDYPAWSWLKTLFSMHLLFCFVIIILASCIIIFFFYLFFHHISRFEDGFVVWFGLVVSNILFCISFHWRAFFMNSFAYVYQFQVRLKQFLPGPKLQHVYNMWSVILQTLDLILHNNKSAWCSDYK